MQGTFYIPIKSFSINNYYCKNRSIKSSAANQWILNTINILKDKKATDLFVKLRKYFVPKLHEIHVDITFFYPKDVLYTKKNTLSSRCHDLSNVEKPIIDIMFLPYYENSGLINLQIDDKHITKLSSEKKVADEHAIEFTITIADRQ